MIKSNEEIHDLLREYQNRPENKLLRSQMKTTKILLVWATGMLAFHSYNLIQAIGGLE